MTIVRLVGMNVSSNPTSSIVFKMLEVVRSRSTVDPIIIAIGKNTVVIFYLIYMQ